MVQLKSSINFGELGRSHYLLHHTEKIPKNLLTCLNNIFALSVMAFGRLILSAMLLISRKALMRARSELDIWKGQKYFSTAAIQERAFQSFSCHKPQISIIRTEKMWKPIKWQYDWYSHPLYELKTYTQGVKNKIKDNCSKITWMGFHISHYLCKILQ